MSATGAGYDSSVNVYSPDGRCFQVEYAAKAVEGSGTVIGLTCKDGVVLGVEKLVVSKMLVEGSNRRVQTCGVNAGLAVAGLQADGRQLVNRCRQESRDYRERWGREIPGKILAERLAGFVHMHTINWFYRPFGCSVLLATYDDKGPGLYMVEPSGEMFKYYAASVGKHRQAAKTELERLKFDELSCRDAVKKVAEILYRHHDEIKDKQMELELTWICEESGRKHVRVPDDLRLEAETLAKEAKQKAEMDDSEDEEEKS